MYNHVMIDIETKSFASILSVAAVRFCLSSGNITREFDLAVDIKSCELLGLKIEADTVSWWLSMNKELQSAYLAQQKFHLREVLNSLAGFIHEDDYVWGNSARFDLGILQNAYDVCRLKMPWQFKNEMCVRTVSNLFPQAKEQHLWKGTAHNPLSDCKNQVAYLVEAIQQLKVH